MGNQLTQPARLAASEAVADLGGALTFKDSLGTCRGGWNSVGGGTRWRRSLLQECCHRTPGALPRCW